MIGRRRETQAAVEHLGRAATTGAAHLLLVEGLAGIGKSTVLDATADALSGLGFRSVRVTLTAAETSLSWAGLSTLCSQFGSVAHAALPSAQRAALAGACDGGAPGEFEPMLTAAALGTLLASDIAAEGPLLLIIDDVHWLDQATASALAFAIRRTANLALAVMVASRPERRPLEPDRLLAADRTLRIGLEGMSLAALQELLASRFGVVHRRPDLIRLHEACGGNVMHAIEIGRMMSAGHSLDEALVPPTLRALIDSELARLPAELVHVLEPVALLPRPTVAIIERAFPGAEATLATAEQTGIIGERNGRLSFAHPLLRAGLLDRIGSVRRRQLERRLAEVVDDPEERVVLRAAAATDADEQIAAEVEQIADRALVRGATHVAAARFDRATELTPAGDHSRSRRLLSAAVAHARAGDADRARPRFEAALAGGLRSEELARAVIGLSAIVIEASGPAAAAEQLARAAEDLRGDAAARVQVLLQRTIVLMFDDLRATALAGSEALIEARHLGRPSLLLEAEVLVAANSVLRGEPVDLGAINELVADAVRTAGVPANFVASFIGQVLVWVDDVPAAIESEQAELSRTQATGHVVGEANALQSLADAYRRIGRWHDAELAWERWAELMSLTGSDPAASGCYADLAWLRAMRGRFDEATQLAANAVEHTKGTPIWQLHALAYAGVVAATRGDFELAHERLSEARAAADDIGFADLGALQFRDSMVEVLVALGRVDEATEEASRISALARRAGRPRGSVIASRSWALVAAATGDLAGATDAVADALAALADFDDPFERARVLQVGGTVARRAGRRTESREQLAQARRLFDSLGAVPFVERVDAELARLGARTGRTDMLTHSELQVALLVCDGRTNAEAAAALFITPRTVEAHLTRVYRKLGVRSRAELVARRSLLDA